MERSAMEAQREALGWFTTQKLSSENRQRIKILGAR